MSLSDIFLKVVLKFEYNPPIKKKVTANDSKNQSNFKNLTSKIKVIDEWKSKSILLEDLSK
jgi:hypothetical protein